MTHRLPQILLVVLFLSACFFIATPLLAQDSAQPDTAKSSTTKGKKTARSSTGEESAKGEDTAAKAGNSDEGQPTKTDETKTAETKKDGTNAVEGKTDDAKKDEAKKKEDVMPAVESPKLIEVPKDETTYTPRSKIVAVFVFTNGNRIESDDYLITKDALFINKDGQKTRYPINTVDRAATKAANESRGVEIVFPKSKSEFNLDF